MSGKHRIDVAGKLHVAVENGVTQLLVTVLAAQHFELVMKVEDDCRMGKTAGGPARLGMQANDKERLPAKAEREMRIFRVGTHSRIMVLAMPGILVGQGLNPIPQVALEVFLTELEGAFENNGETGEERRLPAVVPGKAHQPVLNGDIVP